MSTAPPVLDAVAVSRIAVTLGEVGQSLAFGPGPGESADAERVELLSALEDLKAAACAAQARVAVDLDISQREVQEAAGVRPDKQGAGVGAQVALARRESPHRGGRLLGLAKALAEMPHTFAALESGRVNEWRATLIVRETACLPAQDRRAVDAELWADPAQPMSLGDRGLTGRVRALAYRRDPIVVTRRAAKAANERTVSLRPAPDTMAYLTALLPVADGVAAYAALTKAADAGRAGGDPRNRGQLLADTLVERLTGRAATDPVPVAVNLVMTDHTLLAGGHDPATLGGHGPVPAGVARRLVGEAADQGLAWLRRVYTHPGTGRLIGLESRARRFPAGLAGFLDLRDQVCRTPWCDAPIRHHDHVQADAAGGATTADNGQGLCEACNYAKEAPGWTAQADPDAGTVWTTTPTGHDYPSPEPPPPGPPRRPNRVRGQLLELYWTRQIDYQRIA